jgi:hypothetical protein
MMGMMMMQQQSKQSSRDANHMAREAELALQQEEMNLHCKEMTLQFIKMTNVMLMGMIQNISGTNREQQQKRDIGRTNGHQRTDIGETSQQDNANSNANNNE